MKTPSISVLRTTKAKHHYYIKTTRKSSFVSTVDNNCQKSGSFMTERKSARGINPDDNFFTTWFITRVVFSYLDFLSPGRQWWEQWKFCILLWPERSVHVWSLGLDWKKRPGVSSSWWHSRVRQAVCCLSLRSHKETSNTSKASVLPPYTIHLFQCTAYVNQQVYITQYNNG